jgi:hypothetical protein
MIYDGALCDADQKLADEAVADATPCLTFINQSDTIDSVQISPDGQKEDTMPYNEFGTKFSSGTSQFTNLKDKGDKIRFRLLGAPYVNGKHFEQMADEKWNITPCPRINDRGVCETCNKYFEIMAKAKKTDDKKIIEQAKKDARKYSVAISFYFPVIDRNTGEFTIFQSKMSVKNKIDAKLAAGVKIFDVDFVVVRTETPGSEYYSLDKVDSSDTPPLTDEEELEVEKYKKMDLSSIIMGTKDEESAIAVEANVEVE